LLLVLSVLLGGHRFYHQLRPVPVFLGSVMPMTSAVHELLWQTARALPLAQQQAVAGVPYLKATIKPVSRLDLFRIRTQLAWGEWWPWRVESIMVHSADQVTVRVAGSHVLWVQLAKRDGAWLVERTVAQEHRENGARPPR